MKNTDLTELFINTLGWDYFKDNSIINIMLDDLSYDFLPIAQKRGLGVYLCRLDASISNDTLKTLALKLKDFCYENFIIFEFTDHFRLFWYGYNFNLKSFVFCSKDINSINVHNLNSQLTDLAFSLDSENNLYIADIVLKVSTFFNGFIVRS